MSVVPIADIVVVIGANWLETLGPHVVDYHTSVIKFLLNNDFITFTGYSGLATTNAQCHQLHRLACTDAITECYLIDT